MKKKKTKEAPIKKKKAKIKEVPTKTRRPPRESADEIYERLHADLGKYGVIIQNGTELEGRFDLRRPCGIPSLDLATGGGLPAGGLSQIDGADGSGKNLLVYRYFGEAQRLYGDTTNIFMLCMEFPFDKDYAAYHGFHVPYSAYEVAVRQRARKEEGLPPFTEEEVAAMMSTEGKGNFHLLRGAAEANLDAVVEMIRSNAYQIGAIDSWDSMLTVPEEEADLADDPRIANASNVQTKWMKKVQGALTPRRRCPECWSLYMEFKKHASGSFAYYCANKDCGWKGRKAKLDENETTVIGIRQVRANMNRGSGKFKGPEYAVGGAWALRHGKLVDINLRPTGRIMSSNGKVRIGKEITYELTKGKAGTHEGKKGTIRYFFDPPEVDVDHDLITTAIDLDVIKRGGGTYYLDCMEGEPLKFKGKLELLEALEDSAETKEMLWKKMLRVSGLHHVRYNDEEVEDDV